MKLKIVFTLIVANICFFAIAQETKKMLPAFEANMKKTFENKWVLNRYSENANGIYAEIIANSICYIVEADQQGNIISKKDFFTLPKSVEQALNSFKAYKIEDIKNINENEKALEVIADNKKMVLYLKNNELQKIETLK